jgi:hypothetical protein
VRYLSIFTACPIALLNPAPQMVDFATPVGASLGCPETEDFGQVAEEQE